MSGSGPSTNRAGGRALVVGSAACRGMAVGVLSRLGYQTTEADDPYTAMAEVCRRPLAYRAVVLSLTGLYREELGLIAAVKRRFAHVEVWLTHTDGRAAALAEAMRLGAAGLLSEEGLHRFSSEKQEGSGLRACPEPCPERSEGSAEGVQGSENQPEGRNKNVEERVQESDPKLNAEASVLSPEPVLTAEELRALLQEQPSREAGL